MMTSTHLGDVFAQHHESLPRYEFGRKFVGARWLAHWPWVLEFVIVPALGAGALMSADLAPKTVAGGLLAGVGVMGGLLFQVLAWVSGRIASIADSMDGHPPTESQMGLIERLDIARSNIAYAALLSIFFVVELGVASMLTKVPTWLAFVSAVLLIHLGLTLTLVVLRINRIGESDRVLALTAEARARSEHTKQ